ncbi:hypothetical protein JCM6882_008873 [Rhodosporidiobolus microsporus]
MSRAAAAASRFSSLPLLSASDSSDDDLPSGRSLDACASNFYDDASHLHTQVDALKSHLDTVRALSARLYALHPNSPETPILAADLRDALVDGADNLKRVDAGLFALWEGEEQVREAAEKGAFRIRNTAAMGSEEGEVEERKEEVRGLVKRFARRVREIRREARAEKKDREEDVQVGEPLSLVDYLEKGTSVLPHHLTKDTVQASRWVVENPFSILVRLTDNLKSLSVPQMASKKLTPSTYTPPTPPPLYPVSPTSAAVIPFAGGLEDRRPSASPVPPNPTPLGQHPSSKPLPQWKADLLRPRPGDGEKKPSLSHRFFDEIAQDTAEGWREIKVATGRGHRERWIIFLTLALFPVLLIANLIEDWFGPSSSTSSSSSSSASSSASSPSLSMRSLMPTLMAGDLKIGIVVPTGTMRTPEEAQLRERRRRSIELDGEVV